MFGSPWGWIDRHAEVLLVAALVYASTVVMLRISGKRTLAKLNAFDFVVTVALGSALATTVLSDDVTVAEGVVALGGLMALQFAVALASAHWSLVSRAVKSAPTALVVCGEVQQKAMARNRIRADEVAAALRKHGASSFEEVLAVVLETDGTLSVVRGPAPSAAMRSTLEGVEGISNRADGPAPQ